MTRKRDESAVDRELDILGLDQIDRGDDAVCECAKILCVHVMYAAGPGPTPLPQLTMHALMAYIHRADAFDDDAWTLRVHHLNTQQSGVRCSVTSESSGLCTGGSSGIPQSECGHRPTQFPLEQPAREISRERQQRFERQ